MPGTWPSGSTSTEMYSSRVTAWSVAYDRRMRTLAEGVHQLAGRPPNAINVYLVGDVLVDAGTPGARRRILRELAGREVRTHVVTHAHPDHFGSSHAICAALGAAAVDRRPATRRPSRRPRRSRRRAACPRSWRR